MKLTVKVGAVFLVAFLMCLPGVMNAAEEKADFEGLKLSPQTTACIGCHRMYTPGIVKDWLSSLHAHTIPAEAMKKPKIERRISAEKLPDELSGFAVGCYECHSRNPEQHTDSFDHVGYKINIIVSPRDCSTCHPVEVDEYTRSKKGNAYKNIMKNPVYHTLVSEIDGLKKIDNGGIVSSPPSEATLADTCLGCHGTKIEVKGTKTVSTKMGDLTVPVLANWPSQGVGRENPDGSIGSCTSCHARHSFSIEMARKPYTCGQCHLDPDVPAWNVYKASKHGNIYDTMKDHWNFSNVPWVVGKDFLTPTCATCHVSLLTTPDGQVVAERSHDFASRLWVRLFGLIYSHPQPKSGNTTVIKNKDGLPLPTTFTGEPASDFLIDKSEQERRFGVMKSVCNSCHSTSWINGHFEKLESTIRETNEMTLAATKLMTEAWGKGLENNANPFDETIEKMWIRQWLFYSNSIRYASAMTGAHDYAAFKNGWWSLSENLQQMKDMIKTKEQVKGQKTPEQK